MKLFQVAELTATQLSRRRFITRFGRYAAATVALAGGLLALAGNARPPKVCGTDSSFQCVGKPEGFPCSEGRYSGFCRGIPGKDTSCSCYIKGLRHDGVRSRG